VHASRRVMIGTVTAIADKLVEQRERHGFSYVSVPSTGHRRFCSSGCAPCR
jgi:hypothetical protein